MTQLLKHDQPRYWRPSSAVWQPLQVLTHHSKDSGRLTRVARAFSDVAVFFLVGLLLISSQASAQSLQISGRSSTSSARVPQSVVAASQQEWFRIEFDGSAVGYESLTTMSAFSGRMSDSEVSGRLVRRIRDTRLKLKQFGSDLSVSARLETVESTDGVLQSWSLRRTAADAASIERTGIWNHEKSGFDLTERVAGTHHLDFLPSIGPPRSAILSSWIAAASRESQRLWTSAVLFPETAAIVDLQIHAVGAQSLNLPDGKMIAVTRFDYWPPNSPEMKSSLYYDSSLSLVRIEQPLMGRTLTLERTDAAGALGEKSTEALDLQFGSVLPLKRQLTNLDRSESLRLLITVSAAEQIALPLSDFQGVEQSAANAVIVTLTRPVLIEDTESAPVSSSQKGLVDPVYTSSSRWINSDDESLKRKGLMVAGSTSIPLEKCRRLTRHVWKHMRFSPFSTSLQPAREVAKSLRGDCTEHAVLLSALLRSQGIPARVALGFVYVPNPDSFAPHMWTEAFLNGKWIPFDSTRGPDGVGLTHLKVSDSALSDEIGSGTVLFVPLLSFLGRATVDVAPM